MRNKVILIKGFWNIAPQITLGAYERLNADYIVMIAGLRAPSSLPEELSKFEVDPTALYLSSKRVLEHWRENDQQHLVAAEYAQELLARCPRVIEGQSLEVPWFYQTVRNYHRQAGQVVMDCEVVYKTKELIIEDQRLPLEEAIQKLKPHPALG
jgi:hypothetical protein